MSNDTRSDAKAAEAVSDTIEESANASTQDKRFPKGAKIALIIIGAIIALLLIALAAVNIYFRSAYSSFYDEAQSEFQIPGLDTGFVPQDLDYYDIGETWLFSGYMTDGSPSPLYRRYIDGTTAPMYINNPDGTPYTGHGSAVTSNDLYVYLTCEEGYLVIDARMLMMAGEGETIPALAKVDLDFSPAFMNIEEGWLLAGNFYRAGNYETPEEHHIQTADGMNQAVMYAYQEDPSAPYGFSAEVDRVYSIPDQVQGVCATINGKLIFSTSYGLDASHILIYDESGLKQSGTFTAGGNDVPLFILDSGSLVEDVVAPPMTEGIETHDGRIYISEESASNKYIFGKLYGAGVVYSISVPQ